MSFGYDFPEVKPNFDQLQTATNRVIIDRVRGVNPRPTTPPLSIYW